MMYSHFDLLVNFLLFLFFINLHYFYLIDLINFKKELSFFINFQVMFECKIMDQKITSCSNSFLILIIFFKLSSTKFHLKIEVFSNMAIRLVPFFKNNLFRVQSLCKNSISIFLLDIIFELDIQDTQHEMLKGNYHNISIFHLICKIHIRQHFHHLLIFTPIFYSSFNFNYL